MCNKIQNQPNNTQPEIKRGTDQTTIKEVMEEAKKLAENGKKNWCARHNWIVSILKFFRSESILNYLSSEYGNFSKLYDGVCSLKKNITDITAKEDISNNGPVEFKNSHTETYSAIINIISEINLNKNEYENLNELRKIIEGGVTKKMSKDINKMYLAVAKRMANTKIGTDEYNQLKEMRKDLEKTKQITQKNIIQSYKKECHFEKVDIKNDNKIERIFVSYENVLVSNIIEKQKKHEFMFVGQEGIRYKLENTYTMNPEILNFLKLMENSGCEIFVFDVSDECAKDIKGVNIKAVKRKDVNFSNSDLYISDYATDNASKKGASTIKAQQFKFFISDNTLIKTEDGKKTLQQVKIEITNEIIKELEEKGIEIIDSEVEKRVLNAMRKRKTPLPGYYYEENKDSILPTFSQPWYQKLVIK